MLTAERVLFRAHHLDSLTARLQTALSMSSSKRNRPSPLKSLSEIRSQLPTETHVRAWTIIYDAQRIAKIDTKDIMYARITGHLLLELLRRRKALGITPSSQLVNEIVSIGYDDSERHQIVYRLGETYLHHLLRSCASSPLAQILQLISRPQSSPIEQYILLVLQTLLAHPLRRLRTKSQQLRRSKDP